MYIRHDGSHWSSTISAGFHSSSEVGHGRHADDTGTDHGCGLSFYPNRCGPVWRSRETYLRRLLSPVLPLPLAVAQIDFFVCVGIVKMSITVFNIRLTSMASRGWQIGNWIFLSIIICYIIIAFFLNVIQCVPAATSFDLVNYGKRATAPKCMGIREMGTILRAINITMDYLLLATPIIVLWRVQMSWKKKAWLFALSCVGGLACIGSVMTLVAKTHLKSDPLWNYTGILGWSLVELVFSVLAASLPTLAFLLLPTSIRTNQCEASEPYPSQPSQRR